MSARTKFIVIAECAWPHKALRIGASCFGRERRRVDEIAAVARQRRAVARLGIGRTRLGVLAGETADAHHGQLQAMHEHEAHLQHDLEAVGDQRRGAVVEALRAITALQEEAMALRRVREQCLQRQDFPRRDQRRQVAQLGKRDFEFGGIRIDRLLQTGTFPPRVRRPIGRGRFDRGNETCLREAGHDCLCCGAENSIMPQRDCLAYRPKTRVVRLRNPDHSAPAPRITNQINVHPGMVMPSSFQCASAQSPEAMNALRIACDNGKRLSNNV
jgi:hypothetical protein